MLSLERVSKELTQPDDWHPIDMNVFRRGVKVPHLRRDLVEIETM
jgi:hypothetical protein